MTDQPSLDQLAEQAGAWEWLRGWKGVRFDDCRCGDQYCPSCSFVAMIHRVAAAATQAQRFAPMGDNHHNAAACPYCNPQLEAQCEQLEQLQREVQTLGHDLDQAMAAVSRAEQQRDERFTEAVVRGLMRQAWDAGYDWPAGAVSALTVDADVDRLLAEHKAQQKASVTP